MVDRTYCHCYAVLMDFWNESHCIAAFLRQVLYLINAVHKLYNYTSICHCQIYTLLHTVRLRWFHFIALQMDFCKCISLKFSCSTDRQSTWKTWGSLWKCSTYNILWNKKRGINKQWIFTLLRYGGLSKCRLQSSVPFPHQEHHFRTNSTGLCCHALHCLLIWPTSSLMKACLHWQISDLKQQEDYSTV